MEHSLRCRLPLLAAGQAQKEIFHNEALQLIDLLIGTAVEDCGRNAPPASPAEGQAYRVGLAPTGDWSGQAGAVAGWSAAGWRFAGPFEGQAVFDKARAIGCYFRAGAWDDGAVRAEQLVIDGTTVVAGQQPAIAVPSGGTTVDSQARAAISAILAALRNHGLIAT